MRQGVEERHYAREIIQWSEIAAAVAKSEEEAEEEAFAHILTGKAAVAISVKTEPMQASKQSEPMRVAEIAIARSRKAYGYLYAALPADVRLLIANVPQGYAYGIWSFLEKKFRNTEQDSVLALWKQFATMQQTEEETFDEYKARVDSVVELLNHAKQNIPQELYASLLLWNLQSKYNPAVLALKTSDRLKNPSAIEWSELRRYMCEYERSRIGLGEADSQTDRAMAAGNNSSKQADVGWQQSKGKKKQKTDKKSLAEIDCYNCGKLGHYAANCKSAPKKDKIAASQSEQGRKGGQLKSKSRHPKNTSKPDNDESDDISLLILILHFIILNFEI